MMSCVSEQEIEESDILGSSNSHAKAAAVRISWIDPGVEAVPRLLSYKFQDVSETI